VWTRAQRGGAASWVVIYGLETYSAGRLAPSGVERPAHS